MYVCVCSQLLAYPLVPVPNSDFLVFYSDKALESFSEPFLCIIPYLIFFLILLSRWDNAPLFIFFLFSFILLLLGSFLFFLVLFLGNILFPPGALTPAPKINSQRNRKSPVSHPRV